VYIAVDIGGTKVTVAEFVPSGSALELRRKERYHSRDYTGLEGILASFAKGAAVTAVGIGVAGPVVERTATVTNLPWVVAADAVAARLGVRVELVNDLEAHGYGIPLVARDQLVTLNEGRRKPGNIALIAAGTGLGEAILFWDGHRHVPRPSEGGHATFGPSDTDELELAGYLMRRHDHVSWERVVSGLLGFRSLLDFLVDTRRIQVPERTLAQLTEDDVGAEIVQAAAGGEPWAQTIMDWFVRLYGAETGNLALKALSLGGVYIAGGIAPRILPWLKSGRFMAAMTAKGRFARLLEEMPVHVVLDEDVALKGAAVVAVGWG
jgi:glucokinase